MPPKSRPEPPWVDQTELTTAVRRLADLVEILAQTVEDLVTEIQWHNNERSQDYRDQHLPLTGLPRDRTTRDWHPKFGDAQRSPIPADTGTAAKPKSSRLFD